MEYRWWLKLQTFHQGNCYLCLIYHILSHSVQSHASFIFRRACKVNLAIPVGSKHDLNAAGSHTCSNAAYLNVCPFNLCRSYHYFLNHFISLKTTFYRKVFLLGHNLVLHDRFSLSL